MITKSQQPTSTNKSTALDLTTLMYRHGLEWLEEKHPDIAFFLDKFEEQTTWEKPKLTYRKCNELTTIDGMYHATNGSETLDIPCSLRITKRNDNRSFLLIVNKKRIPLSYNYDIRHIACMVTDAIPEQYRDPSILRSLSKLFPNNYEMELDKSEQLFKGVKDIRELLGLKDAKHVVEHLVSGNDTLKDLAMISTYQAILLDAVAWYHHEGDTELFSGIKYAFKGMIEDAATRNNHISEYIRNKWFNKRDTLNYTMGSRNTLLQIWKFCCYEDPIVFNTVVHKLYKYLTSIDNEQPLIEKPVVEEQVEEPNSIDSSMDIEEYDRYSNNINITELIDWLNNHK